MEYVLAFFILAILIALTFVLLARKGGKYIKSALGREEVYIPLVGAAIGLVVGGLIMKVRKKRKQNRAL
jgi:membrane protein DedA with SNARE-associated domain